MSEQSKTYDPKAVEPKWLNLWNEKKLFHADPHSKKPAFCIVIPPPNVTGMLHMGHALVNTLQDVLIRWKRMQGFEALWVPGTDHAGIATQTVVERKLIKEHGKRRIDFPREEFLAHVWQWKEENEHNILNQLKKLGSSCDWERGRFTMDEKNNLSVRTMFKKLYDQGLIVRGDYLVNWDPVTQTALADDEVEYEERQGFIWTLKYPIKDSHEFIQVATTRPETMLGDTAVAVSPKDERYKHLIGKMVSHPLTGREIPIISDHFVDPTFGTGAVKITPAHDPNDYEMGLRHTLPFITMMTPDGKVNEVGGAFEGMPMLQAREAIVEALKNLNLLEKISPHVNRVGVSYRSKAVIEPFISKQWFIKMDQFKAKLKSCVAEGRTKLIPKSWDNTYYHWIDNLRDWCISRQLWWGHRIPIWYKKSDPTQMKCLDSETFDDPATESEWEQDKDVLDTWFSSALWPFAALGWPENTPELQKFYPNATLITGHDILFFWVARMLMMGEYAMEKAPFPETFLHGLIFGKSYWRKNANGGITYVPEEERLKYDLGEPVPKDVEFKWEKMSKSKGNVIDPLEIIEEYGADALRMTMCASATQAREIDLDRRKFEEFRNFTNKFWNGARFVMMQVVDLTNEELASGINPELYTLEDRWILSLLNETIAEVNKYLTNYEFDKASTKAYDFFWKDFCANYVEICKPTLFGKTGTIDIRKNKQKLLVSILDQSTRLLHPMAPFITEEVYQMLKDRFGAFEGAEACAVAQYPVAHNNQDTVIIETFKRLEEVVYTIRNLRGEMKLPPGAAPALHITGPDNDLLIQEIKQHQEVITGLVKTSGLVFEPLDSPYQSHGAVGSVKIAIALPQELIAQEEARLVKERVKLEASLIKLEGQLANTEFTSRAPAALIEKTEQQLEKIRQELLSIEQKIGK